MAAKLPPTLDLVVTPGANPGEWVIKANATDPNTGLSRIEVTATDSAGSTVASATIPYGSGPISLSGTADSGTLTQDPNDATLFGFVQP